MCQKVKIEKVCVGSTVEYRGKMWVILPDRLSFDLKKACSGLKEGVDILTVSCGIEVVSHAQPSQPSNCELPVISFDP